jgi:hypothetical protein
MHPDVPDLGPRVQPLAEGVEGAVLGAVRAVVVDELFEVC